MVVIQGLEEVTGKTWHPKQMETFPSHEHIWEDKTATSLWFLLALPTADSVLSGLSPNLFWRLSTVPLLKGLLPLFLSVKGKLHHGFWVRGTCLHSSWSPAPPFCPLNSSALSHSGCFSTLSRPPRMTFQNCYFHFATACSDVTSFDVTLSWVSHSKYASLSPGPLAHSLD